MSAVCLQFPDMTSLSRNGSYPDDSKTENLGDLYTKIKDADQSSFPDGTKMHKSSLFFLEKCQFYYLILKFSLNIINEKFKLTILSLSNITSSHLVTHIDEILKIFLSLRFYVKSILEILKVEKLLFLHSYKAKNYQINKF